MTTLNSLLQNLELLSNVVSVRRKNNSYALDTEGYIIAFSLSGSKVKEIVLDKQTKKLEYLYLSGNKELTYIEFKTQLNYLKYLDISDSAISGLLIPKGCTALEQVYLQNNKMEIFDFQGDCPSLILLDISNNLLSDLILSYGFNKLAYLYVNMNPLVHSYYCSNLPNLEILHLRNNDLEELTLPSNFLTNDSKLETLCLYGNRLPELNEFISDEEHGNSLESIRYYLLELQKGKIINERAKLVLVGNGRVGKTSIYRRLKDEPFNKQEPYTHGIKLQNLNKHHLPKVKTNNLQLSVWDFGGQEIFYATHQFFLSNEAVYILAWTNEKNVEEHQIRDSDILPFNNKWRSCDYWLDNIRLHGKTSPIIMVQTNHDCRVNRLDVNPEWKKDPYYATCIDFSAENDNGLNDLKDLIAENLSDRIPMFGKEFPVTYNSVILKLATISKTEISMSEFNKICEESKITIGGESTVLDYLAKTGIVVYFNTPKLKEIIYIDPNWLTGEVYRLINNKLSSRRGEIDTGYLDEVLSNYTFEERYRFLELLIRFELIFQTEEIDVYIAPQYLPLELGKKERILFDIVFQNLNLSFVFRFPKFIPENVMINFLSRYGSYSDRIYWKNGIFFTNTYKQHCIVQFDETLSSLSVYTTQTLDGKNLQYEICQAFVELSKNTNAEISIDGKAFASWQDLKKHAKLYDNDINHQFFAIDGKTPLSIKDFVRFLNKDRIFTQVESISLTPSEMDNELNDLKKQVRTHISNAKTELAIKIITNWANKIDNVNVQNNIAMLNNAWTRLMKEALIGMAINVDEKKKQIEYNILYFDWSATSIIDFFDEIKENKEPEVKIDLSKIVTSEEFKALKKETMSNEKQGEDVKIEKKKILFIAANPNNETRLETDKEHRIIKSELERGTKRDRFEFLQPQFAVTIVELLRSLNDKPEIIHFSGHGEQKGIIITDDDNSSQLLPLAAIRRLFKPLKDNTRLVLLNACYSAEQAAEISKLGIYVVGHNMPIGDEAAIAFAQGLYIGLGEGKSIEDAYDYAMIMLITRAEKYANVVEVWKDGLRLDL